MSSKNHKNSKKTSNKKMSVYSMVPTLFILERPSPSKYLNPSRAMNNQKQHPLAESYTPSSDENIIPDRRLNKSSSIEDIFGESEQSSYKLTITSNNDETGSSIGKIDGHLKRNCGLELTMNETKDELEINMKFATRCLISSLNIEFLTTIGKQKKLYTPRSAKSSREFTKGMIEKEPELDTNNITGNVNEAMKYDSRKRVSKVPTIETDDLSDESNLNNTLNSIDDRFKDKNFNKNYNPEVSNMRHSPSRTDRSERVFVPLNDIKYNEEEDDEAQDTLGELRSNDDCIPFPSLSQTTTTFEPKAPPNTPSDENDTIPFPTSDTNTENTEPFPSSNSNINEDTVPFPSSNTEENSIPFPSSNKENSIPFPSSNPEESSTPFPSSIPEENSIPFPSSNPEENSIPFPSSNPEENSIPFPSSNPEENSIPFPSSKNKSDEDTVPFPSSTPKPNSSIHSSTNKRSSAVPKQKPILEKKLNGGRKGRRRSISSPPPPFPDLNTTLNIPSNDEGDNDVLCHLRDIDVQVTYMKGYSSYTPQVTQVSRNLMNYDNLENYYKLEYKIFLKKNVTNYPEKFEI